MFNLFAFLSDDIIRLRQQQQNIDDSDEDEDDDYPPRRGIGAFGDLATLTTTSQQPTEIVVDPTVQPTKKLNGVRRTNDAAVMGRSSSGAPSVNTHAIMNRHDGGGNTVMQRTQQEQQINNRHQRLTIATTAEANDAAMATTLPFAATSTTDAIASTENASATTTITSRSTQLPQFQFSNNTNNNCNIANRRRPHVDLLDQYSSQSYSRLSNSSYPDETEEYTSTSATPSPSIQQTQVTPSTSRTAAAINGNTVSAPTSFKRRKLAIAEYINVRRSSTTIDDDDEVNNNEQNNNDIFCVAATSSNGNNNHFDCNNINQLTEEEEDDIEENIVNPNADQFIVVTTRCTTPTPTGTAANNYW